MQGEGLLQKRGAGFESAFVDDGAGLARLAGLVRHLDFESIIDLVGEGIRQAYDVGTVYIAVYDKDTNLMVVHRLVGDKGHRGD